MTRTLHIIANCTCRKRAQALDLLCLRTVPPGTLEERARSWCNRLKHPSEKSIRAEDLYAGDHWAAVQRLQPLAEQAGFRPVIWIISAGYGLVSASTRIHPYSATFSGAHPDTVTAFVTDRKSRASLLKEWWKFLTGSSCASGRGPRSLSGLAQSAPRDYYLVIASPDYLLAVGDDLLNAANQYLSPDRLLIVSSRDGQNDDPLGQFVIPSSARLQSRVGGARASLNARVASLVLKKIPICGFNADALRNEIRAISTRSPKLPAYGRTRIHDSEVRKFIRHRLSESTPVSFSSLLREFRDSGRACEATRFKNLYYEVKENHPEA
jgi:hypothetical protein